MATTTSASLPRTGKLDARAKHAWFIAFAPIDNPKIAIAIIAENAEKKMGKDIAREVLDVFFNDTKVKNSTPNLAEEEHAD